MPISMIILSWLVDRTVTDSEFCSLDFSFVYFPQYLDNLIKPDSFANRCPSCLIYLPALQYYSVTEQNSNNVAV